jgi:hypothetical protein
MGRSLDVAAGPGWRLVWQELERFGDFLSFVGPDRHGQLAPDGALTFAWTTWDGGSVVWGLATDEAVAVRVSVTGGDAVVEPVLGPEVGGCAAFAVALPAGAEPDEVAVVGRHGEVLGSEAYLPVGDGASLADRVEVRAVQRDEGRGRGTVVLEGRVDDGTWEFAVSTFGTDVHTSFQLLRPGGGGGGGDGGPRPVWGAEPEVRVGGAGTSGPTWHLHGWATPDVASLAVHLAGGGVLRVPTGGLALALGFVAWAVALPDDRLAVVLDGLDAAGREVARVDVRGHLGFVRHHAREHRARAAGAAAPAPAAVESLWSALGGGDGQRFLVPVDADDVAARWPVRPLPLPPPGAGGRFLLTGERHQGELHHNVHVSLLWLDGPALPDVLDPWNWVALLDGGAVLVRQSTWWSAEPGTPETPTTEVRGHPAAAWEHTREVNNLDHLAYHWRQPLSGGAPAPWTGVAVSVEGHPAHHTPASLRALAEGLVELP